MEWLRDLLTDDHNQYDIGFCGWFAGVIVFLILACLNWQRFDPQTMGIGFAAILGAGGAMSWMRTK